MERKVIHRPKPPAPDGKRWGVSPDLTAGS